MKQQPAQQAFREGFDARVRTAEATPCPYSDELASDWFDGWAAADEQLRPQPLREKKVLAGGQP